MRSECLGNTCPFAGVHCFCSGIVFNSAGRTLNHHSSFSIAQLPPSDIKTLASFMLRLLNYQYYQVKQSVEFISRSLRLAQKVVFS
jgi:hypothetical protein